MANLVKIKQVYLYGAWTQDAQECYDIKKLLDDNNIPYQFLTYNDPVQHGPTFDALSTWTFKGVQRPRADFRFPIVYWTNLYDDYETDMELAIGLAEFNAAGLLTKNVPIVE